MLRFARAGAAGAGVAAGVYYASWLDVQARQGGMCGTVGSVACSLFGAGGGGIPEAVGDGG
jgi:hypothetical protein